MGTLVQDICGAADQIARALRSSNYRANFSPQSLWEIDQFFDDHGFNGAPKPKGLLAEQTGQRLFALGGYVGETIRKKLGGEWQANDTDPQGEINIALKLPDGSLIWPVQRVMKRLKNGSEDGIAVYGLALGLDIGPKPEPFSTFRGQSAGASTSPVVIPAEITERGLEEQRKASRSNTVFGAILLFLGSMLAYALLALLIASFWDRKIRMLPAFTLFIIVALIWGGVRLCSGWRVGLGRIWLCFVALALFNSYWYRHLQNDPVVQSNESGLRYLTIMSQSELVMAGVSLVTGIIFILLHRGMRKAEANGD